MYNWINKEQLINQADEILSLDEFIPNAFLTVIMESNDSNFGKVVNWIESHQKEYNLNSRERALIGTNMIELHAFERKEVLLFIENNPKFKDLILD